MLNRIFYSHSGYYFISCEHDTSMQNPVPRFTTNWFSRNESVWRQYVVPHLRGRAVRALEIGSYEGRSATWLLKHALNHRDAVLVCIDDWMDEHGRPRRAVFEAFKRNVAVFSSRVRYVRGKAAAVLRSSPLTSEGTEKFDFVYLDTTLSSASSRDFLEHAVLCWPLLKPGGMLVFDDYTHNRRHDTRCPRPGIDAFLNSYAHELKTLHVGWQVIVIKRRRPLRRRPCRSELFHESLRRV